MSTTTLPTSIRALLQPTPTSTTVTLVTRPLPQPDFTKNEHLLRVHTASPCAGELTWPAFVNLPDKEIITCDDVAGIIVSAPESSPFQPGSKVYARTSYSRPGCARDYAIVTGEEMSFVPGNLSWCEAAAVPLAAETAWQALFKQAGVGEFGDEAWKGKRVLVTAASGGVGSWIVQIARLTGATVIGTCGTDNVQHVKGLGAEEVLDYRTVDVAAWGGQPGNKNKVDLVIDCVGGKALEDAWWCVRENGVVVSIREPPEGRKPAGVTVSGVRDLFFIMEPSGEELREVTKLIEEGKCWPVVDSVWPLEQFRHAYQRLDGGHARGKVVFDLLMNTRKL